MPNKIEDALASLREKHNGKEKKITAVIKLLEESGFFQCGIVHLYSLPIDDIGTIYVNVGRNIDEITVDVCTEEGKWSGVVQLTDDNPAALVESLIATRIYMLSES